MGWSCFPLTADSLITKAPFEEVRTKLNLLLAAWGINTIPAFSDEQFLDVSQIITVLRNGVEALHYGDIGLGSQGAQYRENDEFAGKSIAWVLDRAIGQSAWSSYGLCKVPGVLNEIRVVVQYVKTYAYVRKGMLFSFGGEAGFWFGFYRADAELLGSDWKSSRQKATSLVGEILNREQWPYSSEDLPYPDNLDPDDLEGTPWIWFLVEHEVDPLERWLSDPAWNIDAGDPAAMVACDDIELFLKNHLWPSALNNANCTYKIVYKGAYVSGALETPIKIDGTTVHTYVGEGASGQLVHSYLEQDINHASLDFTNGSVVTYDTSGWAGKIFVPPDDVTHPTWLHTPSQDYTVDDVVTHEGNTYLCIQDNSSSTLNEPGTAGGDPYWEQIARVGWYRGDSYNPQNQWTVDTNYAVDDLVYLSPPINGLTNFKCKQAHTSTSQNMPTTIDGDSYWESLDPMNRTSYSWGMPRWYGFLIKPYFATW